jgi:hypothetical protein
MSFKVDDWVVPIGKEKLCFQIRDLHNVIKYYSDECDYEVSFLEVVATLAHFDHMNLETIPKDIRDDISNALKKYSDWTKESSKDSPK